MPETIDIKDLMTGKYTDKYFLRSKQILEAEDINPVVRYQVFARKPGTVSGMEEAAAYLKEMAGDTIKIYGLPDGSKFVPLEPLMKLEGPAQNLIDTETVYLGLLSSGLTGEIDMNEVERNAKKIIGAADGLLVFYFGARHYHPLLDEEIAGICRDAGFAGCSTDIGARHGVQKESAPCRMH